MSNEQKLINYVEEAKECLAEALDLLLKLKDLVKEAKPMIEEFKIMDKELTPVNHQHHVADIWLAKFKDLFPNEA